RPRSCVIRMVDMPRWRVSSVTRSITVFCVVTSRPVVGSSAIRSCGLQASANAMTTRWHMPPESSNGIGVIAFARTRNAYLVEDFDRLRRQRRGIRLRVLTQHVFDLHADLADRI